MENYKVAGCLKYGGITTGDVMRKLFDKAGWKVIRQNGSHMRVQKG